MPDLQPTETEALDKLKAILLSSEKDRIAHLEAEMKDLYLRLNDKEQLLESLDPIIADLLYKKIIESKSQMAEALGPVMGGAIRKQIAEAKDDMADALYPVIGQAVRKSVAEAMKNLMQAINERIDNIVNQGFRSGKKVDHETLLKQSLPFHLQEIFLIHKKTGLLLSHASFSKENNGNEDVISGMLSAIREFSKTAFAAGGQSLHEIKYEDLNIIIEDGKYAYLAFVVKGVPSTNFKEIIKELENKIHLRFYKDMRGFDGETSSFTDVKDLLSGFISSVHEPMFKEVLAQEDGNKSKPKGVLYLLILILIIVSIYFFWPSGVDIDEKYSSIIENYQNKPGSFFTAQKSESNIILKGSVFEADRDKLISELEGLELNIESQNLFILPSFEQLQAQLLSVKGDLNTASELNLVVDSSQIIIGGTVESRQQKFLAATLFAEKSSLPVVINEINVATNKPLYMASDIDRQVLYFEIGSSKLTTQSIQVLDSVLLILDSITFNKINIHGFADSSGPHKLNQKFASERAMAVKKHLLENGVPPDKVGISSAVLENGLETSIYKSNRRVIFKVE
ncbi:MAG: OmpA family protein [Calditrichaeota bacterium]|nr:MAG: OmpA family protein [Calditrichota bacterium]MBL1206018.1 OmpA family protein [Calditrichota bacterium]NOG45846.1 OmpA family protein [Calditrichota bacterium]